MVSIRDQYFESVNKEVIWKDKMLICYVNFAILQLPVRIFMLYYVQFLVILHFWAVVHQHHFHTTKIASVGYTWILLSWNFNREFHISKPISNSTLVSGYYQSALLTVIKNDTWITLKNDDELSFISEIDTPSMSSDKSLARNQSRMFFIPNRRRRLNEGRLGLTCIQRNISANRSGQLEDRNGFMSCCIWASSSEVSSSFKFFEGFVPLC